MENDAKGENRMKWSKRRNFLWRKIGGPALSLALAFACLPLGAAEARAADGNCVIDMHGARTYAGLSSDWGKKWDEDNFTDVTDGTFDWDGDLTVKAGSVDSVSVTDGNSRLTVSGGTVGEAVSDGSVTVTDGTVKSVAAEGDVRISKTDIRRDVTSDSGDVELSGDLRVGGDVSAGGEASFSSGSITVAGSVTGADVTFGTGVTARVSGTVKGTETIRLNACTLAAAEIDGDDEAVLDLSGYKSTLPALENMREIILESNATATADHTVTADSLVLKSGSEFTATDPIELGSLEGPGVLCFHAGELTVHDEIGGSPRLVLDSAAGSGDTAFRADSGAVSEDDAAVVGFDLEKTQSGGMDVFRLALPGSDGLTLDRSSAAVEPGYPVKVTASVRPKLSEYATGTKIIWELHGDAAAFSKSASGTSCTVSVPSQNAGQHRAVLVAYLADQRGDILDGYRADSCALTTGSAAQPGDVQLDTSYVSILVGDRYGVLATTNAALMPAAVSYRPSVASVGGGRAVLNSRGQPGWFYTVTGVSPGDTTVDIAGQQMAVKVNSGVMIDTLSYTMGPGARYCIGLLKKGLDESRLSVSSTDGACVSIEKYREGKDGVCLYRITGKRAGSADVVFQVAGGQTVRTHVTVSSVAKPWGKSARLVALAG